MAYHREKLVCSQLDIFGKICYGFLYDFKSPKQHDLIVSFFLNLQQAIKIWIEYRKSSRIFMLLTSNFPYQKGTSKKELLYYLRPF